MTPFRLLPAVAALAACATRLALPASAEVLGSTVWDWSAMAVTPAKTGEVRDFVAAPTPTLRLLHVHVSTLNPFPAVPPHHHPTEGMTVVRQGSVRYVSDGKIFDANAGDFFFMTADAVHTPYNVTSQPVVYYAIEIGTEATPAKPGPSAETWAGPGRLHTGNFPRDGHRPRPTPFGTETLLVSSPTATLMKLECLVMTVNPGMGTGERREPEDELLFLGSGTLEVGIKGVAFRPSAGSVCFKASKDPYEVKNYGTLPGSFHLVRFTTASTPR